MVSADVQNDLLRAASQCLIDDIKSKVLSAGFYSLLADEVKDVSKRELLGVSLRYVLEGKVRERAIGFVELKGMSAVEISEHLIKILESFNFMSGKDGGVQALMRQKG